MSKKLVDPAYNDIAEKYKTEDIETLARHVLKGSVGRWGLVPMPPSQILGLTEEEATTLVEWILTLK